MQEELVSLRNEALAAQQQRLDLARFKIVSIAVIGAIAIGTSDLSQGSVPYVIGLIPLVAIYIDVIMETKKIQFMAIGAFLNTLDKGSPIAKYEAFVEKRRAGFLKNYSYQYSTMVVCAGIFLLGIGRIVWHQVNPDYALDPVLVAIEIVSGAAGYVAAYVLNKTVSKKIKTFQAGIEDEY